MLHRTTSALAMLVVMTPSLMAQDKLEKKVVDIVKQTGELYKNAKSMHADGTFASKISNDEGEKEINVTAVIDVEKPSHFSLKTKLDGDAKKGPDIISDGKNIIIYRKALNQYTEQASPKSLGEIGLSLLRIGPVNTGMLFANILADDPGGLLMDGVTECSYVGMDKVDGTPVHRMKFTQPQFDWELWVASEGKPYILRMTSTGEGPNGKVSTVETYKNWKFDPPFAKETFRFTAPQDAKKVDSFQPD